THFVDPHGLTEDDDCCVWITIIIKVPGAGDPDKLGRLGLSGHTGIAVGSGCNEDYDPDATDFFDFGPATVKGASGPFETGAPWWDRKDVPIKNSNGQIIRIKKGAPEGPGSNLNDILANLDVLRDGLEVWEVRFQVKKAQADRVKGFWQHIYKTPPMYSLPGFQCTSSVRTSLQISGLWYDEHFNKHIGSPLASVSAMLNVGPLSPQDFLKKIEKNVRNTCGPDAGEPATLTKIRDAGENNDN
ncbi:MAG: hypothetical protein NT069_31340, partial [Planctomycetota bacterium]|nr:hypothetical protein [Planctomycetota bacterium]